MNRLTKTRIACAGLGGLSLALGACSGSSSGAGGTGAATAGGGGHSARSTTPAGKAKTTPAASHHGKVETCKLITQAEATKALGESAEAGQHDPDSDSPTDCTWGATNIDHFGTFVSIDVEPAVNFNSDFGDRNTVKSFFVITEVPGLGDKAFTESGVGADASHVHVTDTLRVKKGDVALIINVLSPSLTQAQGFAADKVLARAALGRL